MPWCPKCKDEFQEGYTICSDCNVELVDELVPEEVMLSFFQAEQKEIAEKLIHYFEHSDLNAKLEFNEEKEVYEVLIAPEMQKQAKKLYQAFYLIESEKYERRSSDEEFDEDSEDSLDENEEESVTSTDEQLLSVSEEEEDFEEDSSEDADLDPVISEEDDFKKMDELLANSKESALRREASAYIMKADQYKDLNSTVIIFTLFGVVGLVFTLLNIAGVIKLFDSWLFNLLASALFLYFTYVGLSTYKKAKEVKAEIEEENKLTEQINEWLTTNITEDFLSSHQDDNMSAELNYIKITEIIREMLLEEFGEQNHSYLDQLIEEYYTNNFDNAEDSAEE